MNRQKLEAIRKNNAAIVQDICADYGLYGNVIYYEPSPFSDSSLNRMYVVAGFDPALGQDPPPRYFRPDEVLQNIKRNEKLFYPAIWVLDLKETKDESTVTNYLVDYCEKAELVAGLYGEYGLGLPKVLRESEVFQLMNFRSGLDKFKDVPAMRKKYRKDLNWFFQREKSKGFRRRWLNYFRTEKFPDDKGAFAKILGYFRRNKCETSLKQLLNTNSDISKLEMQEYEFRIFQKLIQERYPFVTYAAGDKEVVDHGINHATRRDDSPFGKCVTQEEYAVICKDRFADEGWDCVANLKPAYWEFRDVYYRDCDKPLIASVYQHIALQYAKSDSLGDLRKFGPMRMQKVSARDFMNFVSLAKANKLRFYIDTLGEYETPSFDTINVLYNEYQQQKMDLVMGRMNQDKVKYSHAMPMPGRPSLTSQIHEIEEKSCVNPSRHRRITPPFEK